VVPLHNQPGYYGIKAPSTLGHRYIFEDVPMSLVPIAWLGERFGVSVSGMDSIIRLACIVHRTDYCKRGRTVDKLGSGILPRRSSRSAERRRNDYSWHELVVEYSIVKVREKQKTGGG
jgi:hypothetical protein